MSCVMVCCVIVSCVMVRCVMVMVSCVMVMVSCVMVMIVELHLVGIIIQPGVVMTLSSKYAMFIVYALCVLTVS